VFSVTSEPVASASIQTAQPKTARSDRGAQSDDFGALLDSSLPAGTQGSSSAARQTSASQRRADDDAAATSDRGRSRKASASRSDDTSDDQSATSIADDSGPEATQISDAGAAGKAEKNIATLPRTPTKSGSSKNSSAQQSDKAPAGTAASTDPVVSTPQDAASVIIPAAIAVAIAVPLALADVPAASPSNASSKIPVVVAGAAAGASAAASAGPASALPSDQAKVVSDAVDATASATLSSPALAAAPVIPAASAAPAVSPEKTAVIEAAAFVEAAGQSTVASIPQAAAQTEATPANEAALAAAAIIPSATPKTVQPKSAVAVAAKGAASTPDGKSASSGRSATGTDVLAAEPKPEQPAPVKPESGNDNSDRTKSDAAATKASPPIDSAPAHDHSVLAPTAHPLNDSTDASSQTTTVIQPAVPVAPTTATPAAALSVTAATNGLVPVSGLAFEIAASARSGKSHFDIRLDPADLGRIDVRIDVDRTGQVTSHVTVEKPETLSMLRQDAPQLQRALDDAGFKTGDGGLQFSLRDQSSSGNNWRNETSGNAQRLAITEDESVPATIAGRSYGRMLGSASGVDIRV
jgi:flagellar hook-length control protein FliK